MKRLTCEDRFQKLNTYQLSISNTENYEDI